MYFLNYDYDCKQRIGVLNNSKNAVIPLKEFFLKEGIKELNSINVLIQTMNEENINKLEDFVDGYEGKTLPLDEVKILAPIPFPIRDIICLGLNYLDHANEITNMPGAEKNIPKFPVYFNKRAMPAIGNGDLIDSHPTLTNELDYEVELAVVIGKDGENIKKEEVEDFIFGYTIVNDISARDIQRNHTQWFKGKSLTTHCSMGPYIVHKNSMRFPVELNIETKVNGEIRQKSNTRNFIFDIPTIISDLSKGMPLLAGDIIITGTPAGVGLGFNPPRFLESGDIVECSIEKIGTLTNKVK